MLTEVIAAYWYLIGGAFGLGALVFGYVRLRRRQPKEPKSSRFSKRERKFAAVLFGIITALIVLGIFLDGMKP